MAKSGRGSAKSQLSPGDRIVVAARQVLRDQGYAGCSAREIAKAGGFAQGLVFYHFGTMNELLLAVLDDTSSRRMDRYREALEGVQTVSDLFATAETIVREDLEAGHIHVLTEMIAASSAMPDLRPEISRRLQPWSDLAQQTIERLLEGSPLALLIDAKDAAFVATATYLGVELLTRLGDDTAPVESVLRRGRQMLPLIAPLLKS